MVALLLRPPLIPAVRALVLLCSVAVLFFAMPSSFMFPACFVFRQALMAAVAQQPVSIAIEADEVCPDSIC